MDRGENLCYRAAFLLRIWSVRQFDKEDAHTKIGGLSISFIVYVRNNDVDQACKALKKKGQKEGFFKEIKRLQNHEKPSEKRARQRAEGLRRFRKLNRKRAQREGLLPR